VLHPADVKIFGVMSVLIHVAFAVLFAEITLSFPPPPVRKLALTIMIREGAKGEIIQSEAAWPTPERQAAPGFSPDETLESFGSEATGWIDFETPDASLFDPKKPLADSVDIGRLAAKAYAPPAELFSPPPPELKTMPLTDFALGPAAPEIFGTE
jgi:hypothetical protein